MNQQGRRLRARRMLRRAVGLPALALVVVTALAVPTWASKPPPDTVIDSGPAALTSSTTASFTFHSTGQSATYVCRLDGGTSTACTSPKAYSGLAAGAHTFSVVSTAGGLVDPSPATSSWTIDLTPPSAPTNLGATTPSPTSVVLTWTAGTDNTGVTGNQIVRDGSVLATVGAVTTYTDSTVLGGSTHTYAVKALDGAGNVSPSSTSVQATTPLPPPAPDTLIDSGPASPTKITTATFAFHSTAAGATFTCTLDTAKPGACTSPKSYTGLADRVHTFSVFATANGVSDPTPATATWTVDTTAPSTPANLSATTSATSAVLNWTVSTDAVGVTGYDVFRGGTLFASLGAVTTYTDSTITVGKVYSYAVRAHDAAGNLSALSNTVAATPSADYNPHLTRAPYLTDLVGLHVAINFATDQSDTTGSVQYGAVDAGGSCSPTTVLGATKKTIQVGTTTSHVDEYQWKGDLTLPATGTYCYRVYLGGADLLAANASPTFTTQVPFGSTESFSFDVFGDWGSLNTTGQNADQANLMAQIAASGARFALTVGDNGYPNGNQLNYGDLQQTGDDTSAIFGPKQWTVPGSTIPIFTAVGNHGVSGVTHTDITTWTQDTAVSTSLGRYRNDVYCCVNGSNSSNYGSEWYAFDAGNVRFYVLDSAWGDLNPGTQTPYVNDAAAHFAPGTPEYEWLLKDLTTHPTQLKFAVSHFPFYADNPDDGTDAALDGPGNLEGLLGQHGVQIAFQGHAHMYERNAPSAAGMPITYVTGGGGAALQPIGPCSSNDLYGIGWSWSHSVGSKCGSATAVPTSKAQVFHFLKVTVSGTTVTVAPTDSTGHTFDVQTYTFKVPTDTYIDSAPPAGTTSSSATFTFHASGANATFLCRLDNGTAAACTSPKTYTGLSQAAHTFSVAATVNKSADPTPALATWTVDSTSPAAPTGLTATASSPFSVDLAWTAATDNTGVTGYDVYRDGSLYQSIGPVTSYSDAVLGGSTHQYAVRARDAAGNVSPLSASASATTPAPPAPVFADGFESGDLSAWDSSGGLAVEGSNVNTGTNAVEGDTTNGGTFAKKMLPTYSDAYARVWFNVIAQPSQVNLLRLRDAAGNSLGYVYIETTGQLGYHDNASGDKLSDLAPSPGWHALELRLTVDPSAGVVSVWLDNKLVPGLDLTGLNTGTAPIGQMQIGEVQSGLTYDVAFDDAAFGTSRLGPAADSSAPTVPAGVTATATSPFTADVSWSASSDNLGVAGYDVFRDGSPAASLENVLTWTDTATLPGTTHAYAVRARDASGNVSALSADVPVTQPVAATPVFSDGFETGDLSEWTTSSGLTVQSANVHSGGFAAEGVAGPAYAKETLPSTYTDAYARVAFLVNSQATQATLLRLRDTPTGPGGYLYLTPGGKLAFRSDALTAGTTSSVSPGPGWHALELHLNVTSGAVEVWLDGAPVTDLTFASINLGTAPIGVMQIGDTAIGTWDIVFDDAAFGTSRLGPSGDTSPPSMPANLAGTASSPFSVGLSWDASTDDVGVTGYDVFRDGTLLKQLGAVTTYTDSTVLAGSTYQYTVRSRDAAGNVSALSAVSVSTPAGATPVFSDGFETGDTLAWTTASGLTVQQANSHSGTFAAEGNTTTGATFAKKTLRSAYPDAYARVAFSVISRTSAVTLLRLRDTPAGSGGYLFLTAAGKLAFHSDAAGVTTTSSVSPSAGWHALELHVNISTGAVEVWLDGAAVPDLTLSGINLGTASMGVIQIGDAASTGTWDIALDDAAFGTSRLGPSGDVTPPSTPANVAGAASSAFSVDLSWNASTDNVGVTGYDVFRDGTLLKQLGAVTAYTDSTVLASSMHQYTVRARDAAGNVSPVSAAVPVTTPAAATPLFSDAFESGDLSAWTSPSGLTVQSATVRSGSFAAEGVAGGPAYGKKTVASTSDAYARVAFSVINAGSHQSLALPARGTFTYPWFPESWNRPGYFPATQYHPTLGYYNSVDVMAAHVQAMVYGGFQFDVSSWWGQGSTEDVRLPALLSAAHGTSLKIAPYYEGEGNATVGVTGSPNPSSAQITSDLNYVAAQYIADPNYLWIAGKPALFVYGDATDNCSTVDRWAAANAAAATHFYLVLKVFPGYATCANHPDNWHQYGGAVAEDSQGTHAFAISPGFYKYSEATPRLTRDPARWATNVHDLNCAGADFKLVTTFNEWGEGTSVESADEWATPSGYGSYLDALHNDTTCNGASLPATPASQVTLLRLRDTPTGNGGYLYLTSDGKLAFRSDALTAATISSVSPGPGWHALELHLNITAGAVEVWLDGAAVPDLTFPSINLGTAPIGVMQVGDTAIGAWDVAFDDAAFGTSRLGPSGETTPPSTPANLVGTATSAFSVGLSWDASTDNVGVTGYDVFRDGTLLRQLGAVTTYTDSTVLANSTHQYAVRARDASGNLSLLSAAVPMTTPAANTPVFSDSFESGNLNAWTPKGGLQAVSGDAASGSWAVEGNTTVGATYAKKAFVSTYNDAYARTAFKVKAQTDLIGLLRVRDASAISLGFLYLNATGRLGFHADVPNTDVTSTVVPAAGVWHSVELHVNVTSATVEVWLDGVSVAALSLSGVNLGPNPVGAFQIGEAQAGRTYDILFDDAAFSASRLGI